jgi:hypothetical protein
MDEQLAARVRESLEAGQGQAIGDSRFLPLVTMDSETRLGIDSHLRWIALPPDGRPPFIYGPGTEHVICEAIEMKRDVFEARLEEGARAVGLPPDDVLFDFPTVGLVRSILEKGSPYLTRLALLWLRPTELRDLRADIARVAKTPNMPTPIKELAAHLIVPE